MKRGFRGTPFFMSPEMILHDKFCLKSDIYALGLIYNFLMFGDEIHNEYVECNKNVGLDVKKCNDIETLKKLFKNMLQEEEGEKFSWKKELCDAIQKDAFQGITVVIY